MTALHEIQIGKTRKIIGYTISVLASLMILYGGVMKVIGSEEMKTNLGKMDFFADKVMSLGFLELAILALYWIPRTMNLGFLLMASLTGGILATELIMKGSPFPGIFVAGFFYIGTFLRKPSLFGFNF